VGDGATSTYFDSDKDIASAVAVQSDNKIVVVGTALIHGHISDTYNFGVERFNENGTLDRSFNGNWRWGGCNRYRPRRQDLRGGAGTRADEL
jgi:hypothetical protein